MNKPLTIAVDFDGTIVEHAYPLIGADVDRAIEVLTSLQNRGHRLILWTMRDGARLAEAVEYLRQHGIRLYGVNGNPNQTWTTSPKAFAHIYIDDAAIGCPLLIPPTGRPFVDWNQVDRLLMRQGVL